MTAGIVGHGYLFGSDYGAGADQKTITEFLLYRFDGVGGIFPGFRSELIVGDLHQTDSALFKGVAQTHHVLFRQPADNRNDFPLLYVL